MDAAPLFSVFRVYIGFICHLDAQITHKSPPCILSISDIFPECKDFFTGGNLEKASIFRFFTSKFVI